MPESKRKAKGKYLSYILRHDPAAAGISLDEHGWADVESLISGINKTYYIDFELLCEIVDTDAKGRFSFNEDKTRIRANQGHSINVDPDLTEARPPDILYHGTAQKSIEAIKREGIRPMTRQYVHLSKDVPTAVNVGSRHGSPIVFTVDCKSMSAAGYKFFLSANGVWLTKEVPTKYIALIDEV